MITYRGSKFVNGKKFIINECEYIYRKRDSKDRLIFENAKGIIKLTEDEFNKSVDNVEDTEAVNIVKSYYEDGNNDLRVLASDIVSRYALDDNFPKLQAYLKDRLRIEQEKRQQELEDTDEDDYDDYEDNNSSYLDAESMIKSTNEIIDRVTNEVDNELVDIDSSVLGLTDEELTEKVLNAISKGIQLYADKLKLVMEDDLTQIAQGLK